MSEALMRFSVSVLHEARMTLLGEEAAETVRDLRRLRAARQRAVKRALALAAREKALAEEIAALQTQGVRAALAGGLVARAGSLAAIDRLIERETGLPLRALRGLSRARRFARPRQLGMWLAKRTTDASYPAIARHWNRSDHTTALHAVRQVGRWTGRDADWRDRLLAELNEMAGSASGQRPA
ncbi:helix-turn-helix domain-containing protein [Hoeflea sp.]|uniref:helix-turn-helix domain-containing protein n=1 Tax=Hoeflea sp. TaxID=1940281 RepID=UPI0025C1D3C6|nr:helix-turn-helix domain-containing protein [Hoeflea sp.]